MYRIIAINPDGSEMTLYDPVGAGELPILAPRSTEELNEAGSLEFALVIGHEAYGLLEPKKTFIKADLDGREIFYGRVVNVEPSPMTGQIQYMCAGALSFLRDSEVPPDGKKSDGTTDYKTMTAEAFFRKCVDAHNADVGNDTRRRFTVGTISHSRKSESRQFQLNSYQDTLSVLTQHLIGRFGGFLRVRRDSNGGLLLDWVEEYGDTDEGVLELGRNIISLLNRMQGEDLYTAIRPVGKDGLLLSGSQTLGLFPSSEMAEYGKIIKSVTFGDAATESDLRAQAEALISNIQQTVVVSSEIRLLDMVFTDEDTHGVNLGDCYTNIVGMEGADMIVGARNRDFENPQNDSCTLKNTKAYEGDALDELKTSGGSLSQRTSRNSAGAGYAYKYIHEFQDRLELNTKQISINAEELQIHADKFVETANSFVRLSHVDETLQGSIDEINGTGVIQNSDHITNVAGRFRYDPQTEDIELIEGSELKIHKSDGAMITVGTRLNELGQSIATIEGSALWTQRNNITGIVGDFEVANINGKRTLIVKSGGGMMIQRNNTRFGIWDEGNLTGGILVQKLNNGDVVTKISGDKIDITANNNYTQLVADKNGLQTTVATHTNQIGSMQATVDQFSGSALWTQRNNITGVVGEFEVITSGGVKTLRVKSGGGLKILRNSVEYGVYDSGNLTAGAIVDKVNNGSSKILGNKLDVSATQVAAWGAYTNNTLTGGVLVQKLNDSSTTTQILGSRVNITATQMASLGIYTDSHYDGGLIIDRINSDTNKQIQGVRVNIKADQVLVGSTSNVQAWMNQTGTDIDTLEGLVTDRATIAQLNALDAKIETVKTDYLTVNKLATMNTVSLRSLTVGSSGSGGITVAKGNVTLYSGCDLRFAGSGSPPSYTSVKSAIRELQITQSGNTYTLQKRAFNESSWVNVGSFSRAVSSWTWGGGGGKINVTALPQNQMKSINVSVGGSASITANGTYTYTAYYENGDGDDVSTGATKTITVEVGTSVSSINWSWGNSMYTFTPDNLTSPKKTLGFTDSADIHIAVQTNGVPPTMTNTKWISAPLKIVQMQQNDSPISRYTFNLSINATNAWNAGSASYYNSGYWARPSSSNNWIAKVPNSTVSAAEDWFKLTELSIWNGRSKASSETIYQATTYTPYVKVGTEWMSGPSITITPPNVSIDEDPEIYTDGPGYNTKVTETQWIYDSSKKYMAKIKIGESTYNGTEITFANGYPRSISLKYESSSYIGGGIYKHTFTYEGSASPVPAEVGKSFKFHFNNSGT